jgi:hypothetical protein
MCTPPASTLPGHQVTRGSRIRRAEVRMNRNELRNASRLDLVAGQVEVDEDVGDDRHARTVGTR